MDYSTTDTYFDENSTVESFENQIRYLQITNREKQKIALLKTKLLCYQKIRHTCEEILNVVNDQTYVKDDRTTQRHKEQSVYQILTSNSTRYRQIIQNFPKNMIYKKMYDLINKNLNDYKDLDYVYLYFKEASEYAQNKMDELRILINQYMDTVAGVDITDESNKRFYHNVNTDYIRPRRALQHL